MALLWVWDKIRGRRNERLGAAVTLPWGLMAQEAPGHGRRAPPCPKHSHQQHLQGQ